MTLTDGTRTGEKVCVMRAPWTPTFARAMLFGGPQRLAIGVEQWPSGEIASALIRDIFRDTDEADWPITVETVTLTELNDNESVVLHSDFRSGDIDAAIR